MHDNVQMKGSIDENYEVNSCSYTTFGNFSLKWFHHICGKLLQFSNKDMKTLSISQSKFSNKNDTLISRRIESVLPMLSLDNEYILA